MQNQLQFLVHDKLYLLLISQTVFDFKSISNFRIPLLFIKISNAFCAMSPLKNQHKIT